MKLIVSIFIILFNVLLAQAQSDVDAMRYSIDNITGTARYRAMSGAFGALGGDISSINVNPAGSSVFNHDQISLTMGNSQNTNTSNYQDNSETVKSSKFDANQFGAVFVIPNTGTDWRKVAFALGYERTNTFDNFVYSEGVNPNNSIANYFMSYTQGNRLSNFKGQYLGDLGYGNQQAYFGYERYIINPVDDTNPNNTQYTSNVPAGSYNQKHTALTAGDDRKWWLNLSSVYQDKLYLGMSLNFFYNDFNQTQEFTETNKNHDPTNAGFDISRIYFKNLLYTYGTGLSLQVGGIYKATKSLRIGIGYESPTWYDLNDELTQTVNTTTVNNNNEVKDYSTATASESVITNKFPVYQLQTPWKLSGSAAVVLGKVCLLSFDAIYKDYSSTSFGPSSDDYFRQLNKGMSADLAGAVEMRVGAEYRINFFSLRGGYRHEQSPYKNSDEIGALNGYSLGLGFVFKTVKLDFAYARSKRNTHQPFYTQGFTDKASVENINDNIIGTISLNF